MLLLFITSNRIHLRQSLNYFLPPVYVFHIIFQYFLYPNVYFILTDYEYFPPNAIFLNLILNILSSMIVSLININLSFHLFLCYVDTTPLYESPINYNEF